MLSSSTAFVTTLLYNISVDLWVGLISDSKGHFQWAKQGMLSYTNWAPGEPLDNSGPLHNKTPVLLKLKPLSLSLSLVVSLSSLALSLSLSNSQHFSVCV